MHLRDTLTACVIDDGEVVAVADLATDLPTTVPALLAGGGEQIRRLESLLRQSTARRTPLDQVRLGPPVPRPGKILAAGLNYADHVRESGFQKPDYPIFFNKQTTCVTGPFDPIYRPRVSTMLDYEGELAVVIGTRCRYVPLSRAREVVGGYTVINDVSVRDWQLRAPTMTLGKSFDTHGPMGPWVVTADELGDPHTLRLTTRVNGEVRQDDLTSSMIFNCWQQIETLSAAFTLEPGDIIATGTPAGVAGAMDPPRFLAPGDIVSVEIEDVGRIENAVVQEPVPAPNEEALLDSVGAQDEPAS
jgi:2-keto-4-pentenoate hydratase/2-oxohepta-3-ene-1,7-dioic acid hydratase in catechol pathway